MEGWVKERLSYNNLLWIQASLFIVIFCFWNWEVLYVYMTFHLEKQLCSFAGSLCFPVPKRIYSKWSSMLNASKMQPLTFILVTFSEMHYRYLKREEKKVVSNKPQSFNIFCMPFRQIFGLKTCKVDGFDSLLVSLQLELDRWEKLSRKLAK